MRISVRWLRELVPVDLPPAEIAALFTAKGIGCEEIVRIGDPLQSAAVAEVVSVQDRSVTLFDGRDVVELDGQSSQLGADDKVAFSTAAHRVLMESEIGIEDSARPVILPARCETGSPVLDWIDDEVLVLEVPANRADLTGVVGVARELACYLGRELKLEVPVLSEGSERIAERFALEVRDAQDTPDYIARLVSGVRVGPAPFWLKWRLIACGVRSISNVVDVTNYVLFKYGQPLHGFDYRKLAGQRLITRRANSGESIVTIDGVTRPLDKNVLVIADAERPVAIAGIMGGRDTEITDATSDVVIECARFSPTVIRRGSRGLGLATEASRRFEVGLDTGTMEAASIEAAALMQTYAGATPLAGKAEQRTEAPKLALDLSWSRTARLLGMDLPREKMAGILTGLGFRLEGQGDLARVEVPSHRPDVETPADLAEEIGRIAGYDGVPSDTSYLGRQAGGIHPQSAFTRRLRQAALGLGFDEAQTVSFLSERAAGMLASSPGQPARGVLVLVKPLNERYAALRPGLLAGLLESLNLNLRRGHQDIRLFEIGTVTAADPNRMERVSFAALLSGSRAPLYWGAGAEPADFYDASGIAATLLEALGIEGTTIRPAEATGFEPGATATILAGGLRVGHLGRLAPGFAEEFGVLCPAFGIELDCTGLLSLAPACRYFQGLPKFPAVVRDYALVVDQGVGAASVLSSAQDLLGPVVERAEVFDSFSGGTLPGGKRSVGIRLTFRALDHTLASEELDDLSRRLVEALGRELGAELRE